MIIRELKAPKYESFCAFLNQKAAVLPLDASYTVTMKVNDVEYAVKLQPERHRKIAVLQALQIDRNDDCPNIRLITNNRLLSSFLEILLSQGIRG